MLSVQTTSVPQGHFSFPQHGCRAGLLPESRFDSGFCSVKPVLSSHWVQLVCGNLLYVFATTQFALQSQHLFPGLQADCLFGSLRHGTVGPALCQAFRKGMFLCLNAEWCRQGPPDDPWFVMWELMLKSFVLWWFGDSCCSVSLCLPPTLLLSSTIAVLGRVFLPQPLMASLSVPSVQAWLWSLRNTAASLVPPQTATQDPGLWPRLIELNYLFFLISIWWNSSFHFILAFWLI